MLYKIFLHELNQMRINLLSSIEQNYKFIFLYQNEPFSSIGFCILLRMFIINKMKKYIISIEQNQPYPFHLQQPFQLVVVRVQLTPHSYQHYQQQSSKLHKLLPINSEWLIQVVRVHQIRGKSFIIDYQYCWQSLKKTQKMYEVNFISELKAKLIQLCSFLVSHSIKTELKIQNIGVSKQGEIKLFLGLNFDIVQQNQKDKLTTEYHLAIQRLLQLHFGFRNSLKAHSETQKSDYSNRIDQKLIQMQGKLSRLKLKSPPSQGSSSSRRSTKQKQKNIVLQSLSSRPTNNLSIEISHSLMQSKQAKPRNHKSSFGDYSTASYKLNEQTERDNSLKKRVTNALQKTQQAFKIYQKYSKRKRRI